MSEESLSETCCSPSLLGTLPSIAARSSAVLCCSPARLGLYQLLFGASCSGSAVVPPVHCSLPALIHLHGPSAWQVPRMATGEPQSFRKGSSPYPAQPHTFQPALASAWPAGTSCLFFPSLPLFFSSHF